MEGRNLSPVQTWSLHTLMLLEARERGEQWVDRLKLAVISSDPPRWLAQLYPETAAAATNGHRHPTPTPRPSEQTSDINDADLTDLSGGEWQFTEEVTPEDVERIVAEMADNEQFTVTGEMGEWQ